MNKISVCTVSMNRLHHVRETLPVNIRENLGYENVEFVLLDYNSRDDLDKWIRANMMDSIKSGILKYYHTREPAYFDVSHAKNMATRVATGDVICMVDADNYAGPDFISWVASVFLRNGNKSLARASDADTLNDGDIAGKLSFHSQLFTEVRGFDEALQDYGMDDIDLVNRLVKAGAVEVFIEDRNYMKFIGHGIENRLSNYQFINRLDNMYIQVQTNEMMKRKAVILYVMKDEMYYEVTYQFDEALRKNMAMAIQGWYTEREGYKTGKFKRMDKGMILCNADSEQVLQETDQLLICSDPVKKSVWKKIERDSQFYMQLLVAYSVCSNFIKYRENDNMQEQVNPKGWGKGTVYANFDYSTPILL